MESGKWKVESGKRGIKKIILLDWSTARLELHAGPGFWAKIPMGTFRPIGTRKVPIGTIGPTISTQGCANYVINNCVDRRFPI
jgi:hypothetical protein